MEKQSTDSDNEAKPRAGWEESFAGAEAEGLEEEARDWLEFSNEWDETEWEW